MQTDIIRRSSLPELDDSDEEALDLFNNLHPHPAADISSAHHSLSDAEESVSRPLGRLTKLKKDSKNEKKKLKKKEKKMRRLQKKVKQMEGGTIDIVTPLKSKKHKKRKDLLGSDSEAARSHDAGSSEYSSENEDKQDIQKELFNLNPDAADEEDGSSPRKRLKKSGRKLRIEEKEGFRVEELGNDAEVVLSKLEKEYEDEDYSFDDIGKKGKKKRKPKVSVPTNEQIMNNLKDYNGVVESEGQQDRVGREGAGGAYDNGLDTLYAMKDKRKGAIKVNNKFFCDLEIDAKDEQAQMPTPETLELELKPKTSTHSSSRFTFLSKAEALKKQRGLESNVNMEEYERGMQERAKKSMAKVVTSMISRDYHDDIELEVRVPTIARGKSADIINNTVFLKSFASKHETAESPAALPLTKSCGAPAASFNPKKEVSRMQFYKQIHEHTRTRKSKYISEEQLKDSFKKTNLSELEQARKRNQEKRRKEALSEQSEEEGNEQADSEENKMAQLLDQEERICGDIENQGEENEQEEKEEGQGSVEKKEEDKLDEVEFSVKLNEVERNKEQPANEEEHEEMQVQEPEINEENQIIEELASASHHDHIEEEEEEEGEQQAEEEESEDDVEEADIEQSEPMVQENAAMAEINQQQREQQMELQEEGIMLRKRKMADTTKPKQQESKPEATQPQEDQIPHPAALQTPSEDKENSFNLVNTRMPVFQKPVVSSAHHMTAEEHEQQFKNFKKLRKFAMVIAEKKKAREQGRRYAAEFIENEAEEGSDNEEHDDFIKKIDYDAEEREYEGVDLDADLVQLIDNAVDLNEEDEQEAFRKYLEDMRIKDREEIRKIIRGEFRTRQHEDDFDVDEDDRRRQERMEEVMNWMKQREEEDGQGIYLKPPEEEEGANSDYDSDMEYLEQKRKKAEAVKEDEVDRIPEEEEKAMIERFLENTIPTTKRESKHITKLFELGVVPESVQMHSGSTSKKIGLSLVGSKSEFHLIKLKKYSSLTNEVFSRNSAAPKIGQKMLTNKMALGKK